MDGENDMSDYTPTTETVRTCWAHHQTEHHDWTLGATEEMFDRWLASVKAEAWSEGRSTPTWRNPYRKGQS